jgi:hypothetical protein
MYGLLHTAGCFPALVYRRRTAPLAPDLHFAGMTYITGDAQIAKKRKFCLEKFLYYFPGGFADEKYKAWERNYKLEAHRAFAEQLSEPAFADLLKKKKYREIASTAVRIETKTNLLFSFEKMALRDAVRETKGAGLFANGLYNYLYGKGPLPARFEAYVKALAQLPVIQTRVLTWPVLTVFGFLGNPKEHFYIKPMVTKRAAEKYGYDFRYAPRPSWQTYQSALGFAAQVKKDTSALRPKDYIDLQSFIWVLGSDEYPD